MKVWTKISIAYKIRIMSVYKGARPSRIALYKGICKELWWIGHPDKNAEEVEWDPRIPGQKLVER